MHQTIVPVILVTGFLGSGKTSFLNYVIENNPDKKISLILNEFGDIKLESQFIEKNGIGMVSELSGGCLCCVARVDLPRVIRYTLEKAPQTEYLIIEASGLSDPDPVRATLQGEVLADVIRLDTVVAIVDALNFAVTALTHPLVMSQIAEADLALISKTKNLNKTVLDILFKRVANIGTGTRTFLWDEKFDTEVIFDPPLTKYISKNAPHHTHEHFDEYWYQDQNDHDLEKLRAILVKLPENVLRVKGYLDDGQSRYLLQKVGQHVDIREGESSNIRETAILILGTNLDKTSLQKLFSST